MTERPPRNSSVLPGLVSGGCIVALLLLPLLGLAPVLLNSAGPVSRGGADRTRIGALKSAIHLYMLDHDGRPPRTLTEVITGNKVYLTDVEEIARDNWGRPYHYQVPGPKGERFLITGWGQDGKPAGLGPGGSLRRCVNGKGGEPSL